jgi:hypothetical protein
VNYDGETGEENHGQKAVAKHTDNTANRHTAGAHQIQDNIHASAAHQTNAIDVAKMNLTML